MLSATFITDSNGKKIFAVLPIKQCQHLLEELEKLDDVRAYNKAMARKEKPISLRDAIKERRKRQKA
jgi:hypothetical protein